jgi:hypothetical protein
MIIFDKKNLHTIIIINIFKCMDTKYKNLIIHKCRKNTIKIKKNIC